MNIEVIYEDNHIIAINKRPSEIVQGDKTGDVPLSEKVKEYLKEKYNKPGTVFLGTVHRLDRPVSGVVLFARTSKVLSRLNTMFQNKTVQKTYWAIVKDMPPTTQGYLQHYLMKNEKQNKSYVVASEKSNAKKAELNYQWLASSENYHLLEIHPLTGRHHQIRVQLAAMGCVIKGDVKYGCPRTNKDASIHLHAQKISFIHPVKQTEISILASPPNDSLWNAFINQQNNKGMNKE